jgi:PAS domain S-box-containing protein
MQGYKVLLVEDSRINALAARKLLHMLGHTVVAVSSTGEDALVQVETAWPDIVLMDVHLAGHLNGVVAARIIVERFDVPVVMVTGESDETMLDMIPESLAAGFVKKPIDPEELRVGLSIARHKHALERKLRASEKKFRHIFNNSAAGIYVRDPAGRYLDCNDTFARILGYESPGELVAGVKNIEAQVYVEPGRNRELLALLADQGTVTDFESEVYGRDGDAFWISEHCQAETGPGGEIVRILGVVLDVTARIEAEQAYRSTLELLQRTIDTVPQVVFVLDLECNIIVCNDAFKKLFGTDGEALLGRISKEFICVSCSATGGCFLKNLGLGEGKLVQRFDVDVQGRFYDMTVAPFFDAKGEVIGAVHTLVDAASSRSDRGGRQAGRAGG